MVSCSCRENRFHLATGKLKKFPMAHLHRLWAEKSHPARIFFSTSQEIKEIAKEENEGKQVRFSAAGLGLIWCFGNIFSQKITWINRSINAYMVRLCHNGKSDPQRHQGKINSPSARTCTKANLSVNASTNFGSTQLGEQVSQRSHPTSQSRLEAGAPQRAVQLCYWQIGAGQHAPGLPRPWHIKAPGPIASPPVVPQPATSKDFWEHRKFPSKAWTLYSPTQANQPRRYD